MEQVFSTLTSQETVKIFKKSTDNKLIYFPLGEIFSKERAILKDRHIATLPWIEKEYKIKFDLFINKHKSALTSVLHFTTGENIGKYGYRVPALFMNENQKLLVSNAVCGNMDYLYEYNTKLKEDEWVTIELSQILVDEKVH